MKVIIASPSLHLYLCTMECKTMAVSVFPTACVGSEANFQKTPCVSKKGANYPLTDVER